MQGSVAKVQYKARQAMETSTEMIRLAQRSRLYDDTLNSEADELSLLAELIIELSEQTNLLTINAVFEAGRTGDAEKRFAFVTEEIKQLAKQTELAAREIRTKITSIRESRQIATELIKQLTEDIQGMDEIVDEMTTGENFKEY